MSTLQPVNLLDRFLDAALRSGFILDGLALAGERFWLDARLYIVHKIIEAAVLRHHDFHVPNRS